MDREQLPTAARHALRKLQPMTINATTERCGLELSAHGLYGAQSPVVLDLWADGLTVKRRLDRDEIEAMRDFCNDALAAIDTADEAETVAA